MTEYLPDPASDNESQRKQSVASPRSTSSAHRPSTSTGRPSRSGSTVDSASGSHCHGPARSRRQSAYPNHSRPPPTTAAHHPRRRQHSIAYAPRRSTFSDDRIVESSCPSSRHHSGQFHTVCEFQTVSVAEFQTLPTAVHVVAVRHTTFTDGADRRSGRSASGRQQHLVAVRGRG